MVEISGWILPIVIGYIVTYGLIKKINVYSSFIEGVKEGFLIVRDISPTIIGLLLAVGISRVSGGLEVISDLFRPFAKLINAPQEIIPLALVKMFSSSAAMGITLDIYKSNGPDSYIGRIASIMLSSTETIFYTLSVYFVSIKVTKTRWTLFGSIIASLAGIIASVVIVNILF